VAEWVQLPDTLDIVFVQGDELKILLDFDQSLTGYTFETKIIEVLKVENGNVVEFDDAPSPNLTQTVVNLSLGTINLSLNEDQTRALELNGNYRWFMRWLSPANAGAMTRTVLSGTVTVRSP
jgi:hypothetical protein